ncbi:xanthine dehydrogenase family protein molybdopterin-binding subunit [Rugosimonospora acidiphila]|uniref:Xanthine dehydrogenase family protein molybdopterin-binding subunit n=1 Tax=Rugosimonospora acidiphila TaxID=556531 RepID=A0ABP9RVC3_9ACTN
MKGARERVELESEIEVAGQDFRGAFGADVTRVEGREKVTGTARYAFEFPVPEAVYAWPVPSPFVKGRLTLIDPEAALATNGVLTVLWHTNAMRLQSQENPELYLLQEPTIAYRGQFVALVVADTLEAARHAADLVVVEADTRPHDVVLTDRHPGLYRPVKVNPTYQTDTAVGDFDGALATASIRVDETYHTPAEHNNPMEPHASIAWWEGDRLTVYDSTQYPTAVATSLAGLFGIEPDAVRVIAQHIGGGFGSKGGHPRPNVVLAAMAARHVGHPVKVALTRQHQFVNVGYRTPTIQRMRLGADAGGRLVAIGHDAISQSSELMEFAEQTAVITRWMYAGPHRRTTHRLVRLDVPSPAWMRAPGETPGSFALESAIDELAVAGGWDPVELRIRNDAEFEPEDGLRYSSRGLVACLREGAHRFGWAGRDPRPASNRQGDWLLGTGMAASTLPARAMPSTAIARAEPDGYFHVLINAVDIGTGARTALWQVAARELDVGLERVRISIGDSAIGPAMGAGGSLGTASWGWAVVKACRALCDRLRLEGGKVPEGGIEVRVDTANDVKGLQPYARYSFGAQFCQVRVDIDTGEIRVDRLLGVFAAGRIVNPLTARSQLIGAMTMGISMALFEEGAMDSRYGAYVNRDLATYHVAACADVRDVEAYLIEEEDTHLNPLGIKGLGELGIVGAAAAVANAVYHATGVRVRSLPIRLDDLLDRLDRVPPPPGPPPTGYGPPPAYGPDEQVPAGPGYPDGPDPTGYGPPEAGPAGPGPAERISTEPGPAGPGEGESKG